MATKYSSMNSTISFDNNERVTNKFKTYLNWNYTSALRTKKKNKTK